MVAAPMATILRGPPLHPAPFARSLWDALLQSSSSAPWLHFQQGQTSIVCTREDIVHQALRWAQALVDVCPRENSGQRVGILFPNGPDFVTSFFATQALGDIAVPLPWPVVEGDIEQWPHRLRAVMERARLDVLMAPPSLRHLKWPVPVVCQPDEKSASNRILAPGASPAFIQFTSGSTGNPQGAVISQRAALSSAAAMIQAIGLGSHDVGVSWLPFFHDMGLVGVLLSSLCAQFPVHIMRPGEFLLRPRKWLESVTRARATVTVGPNFAWELAARRVAPEGLDVSSLRCALNGSEPVHRTTLNRFAQVFEPAGFNPAAFLPVYGLAEATLGVAFGHPHSPDTLIDTRPVPSVGRVIPGIELCIQDAQGQFLPDGQEGELCVRGATLMNEYFEQPAATAQAMRGGWLHTGDLGLVQKGNVYVTGREKELVIQSGRKFHPYDIERVVSELLETTPNGVAAVSRPDAKLGSEALTVFVELRRQSNAVDPMHLKGVLLATLGVRADVVEFVPPGTLPRTTSGKVKRQALAQGTWA